MTAAVGTSNSSLPPLPSGPSSQIPERDAQTSLYSLKRGLRLRGCGPGCSFAPARQKSGRLCRRPPPGAQSWSGAQPSSGPEAEQTERLLIRDHKRATITQAAAPFLVRVTPCRPGRQPPGRPSERHCRRPQRNSVSQGGRAASLDHNL